MKRYTDLFIDFDDTLYDTYGNAVIALKETFEHFRLGRWFPDAQVFYDAYWRANIELWSRYSRGEITRPFLILERFRRPLMAYDRPHPQPLLLMGGERLRTDDAYCLQMSDYFLDRCAEKPGLIDGARELMDYLRSRGYRMHMTSNGFHEVQYKKLAACGLREYFDTIILSEDAGANKPSRQFFEYALRRAGEARALRHGSSGEGADGAVSAAATLMIGDNLQTDILGALGAGIDALFFNRWGVDVEGNAQRPTYVVDSLLEIKNIL